LGISSLLQIERDSVKHPVGNGIIVIETPFEPQGLEYEAAEKAGGVYAARVQAYNETIFSGIAISVGGVS
jgi:hypothetical protein